MIIPHVWGPGGERQVGQPGGQHILAWCPFLIPKSDPWPTAWAISATCPAFPGVQVSSALIAQPLQVLR